jgi:acetyl/propionyl-CoA carboxylase alpha subunit
MPVTTNYDSLIAKVIAWGKDRSHAISRLKRALGEFEVGGVATDIEFISQVVGSTSFEAGWTDTTYLDTFHPESVGFENSLEKELAVTAAIVAHQSQRKTVYTRPADGNSWRMTAWREQMH